MAFLFAAVLIALSAGVLVYPFLKSRLPSINRGGCSGTGPEDTELASLLESMRILHLDHQAGNVPDGLYEEQLRAYRVQAASHLRQQMQGQSVGADWDLEQDVLMVRLAWKAQHRSEPRRGSLESRDDPEP